MRHLDQAVDGELLADFVALFGEFEVEALGTFEHLAIHFDLLAEAVVSKAICPCFGAELEQQLPGLKFGRFGECCRGGLGLRCWGGCKYDRRGWAS